MEDEMRIPIADVLPGFQLHALPSEWTPVEAFVLVKVLDEEGRTSWSFRTSAAMSQEELLGALTIQCDLLRRQLVEEFLPENE